MVRVARNKREDEGSFKAGLATKGILQHSCSFRRKKSGGMKGNRAAKGKIRSL